MSNLFLGNNDNMWTWGGRSPIQGANTIMGHGLGSFTQNPMLRDAYEKTGLIRNLGNVGNMMQPQQAPQQSMNPQGTQAFQDKLNRLTINASDALYGGLLGYNPKPIVSPTGNTYNPPDPTGGFRFPFGLLNGIGGQ